VGVAFFTNWRKGKRKEGKRRGMEVEG